MHASAWLKCNICVMLFGFLTALPPDLPGAPPVPQTLSTPPLLRQGRSQFFWEGGINFQNSLLPVWTHCWTFWGGIVMYITRSITIKTSFLLHKKINLAWFWEGIYTDIPPVATAVRCSTDRVLSVVVQIWAVESQRQPE